MTIGQIIDQQLGRPTRCTVRIDDEQQFFLMAAFASADVPYDGNVASFTRIVDGCAMTVEYAS